MKPNYLRLLCSIIKVALNCLFNHRTQIVDGICFGRDTVTNGGSHVAAVYRVLRDLENDFHIGSPAVIEPTFKVKAPTERDEALRNLAAAVRWVDRTAFKENGDFW